LGLEKNQQNTIVVIVERNYLLAPRPLIGEESLQIRNDAGVVQLDLEVCLEA